MQVLVFCYCCWLSRRHARCHCPQRRILWPGNFKSEEVAKRLDLNVLGKDMGEESTRLRTISSL